MVGKERRREKRLYLLKCPAGDAVGPCNTTGLTPSLQSRDSLLYSWIHVVVGAKLNNFVSVVHQSRVPLLRYLKDVNSDQKPVSTLSRFTCSLIFFFWLSIKAPRGLLCASCREYSLLKQSPHTGTHIHTLCLGGFVTVLLFFTHQNRTNKIHQTTNLIEKGGRKKTCLDWHFRRKRLW